MILNSTPSFKFLTLILPFISLSIIIFALIKNKIFHSKHLQFNMNSVLKHSDAANPLALSAISKGFQPSPSHDLPRLDANTS